MVRITNGQYLAIIDKEKIVEIHADSQQEAEKKVINVFGDVNFVICRIPDIISYIG